MAWPIHGRLIANGFSLCLCGPEDIHNGAEITGGLVLLGFRLPFSSSVDLAYGWCPCHRLAKGYFSNKT